MTKDQCNQDMLNSLILQLTLGTADVMEFLSLENTVLDTNNYEFASRLYKIWHHGLTGKFSLNDSEKRLLFKLYDRLYSYDSSLPGIPCDIDWLRMSVNGVNKNYFNITDAKFIESYKECSKHSLCMGNGPEIAWSIYKTIEYVVTNDIPGDIVQCGVWSGGSARFIAESLRHFGDTSRAIYLYDTYEGMPEPDDVDKDSTGVPAASSWNWHRSQNPGQPNWGFGGSIDDVKGVVHLSGYPEDKIIFVKGLVEDTLKHTIPKSISFLHLDTDFYASTLCELEYLFPLLSISGVINIDDYWYYQGVRAAADEYIAKNNCRLLLTMVQDAAVGTKA